MIKFSLFTKYIAVCAAPLTWSFANTHICLKGSVIAYFFVGAFPKNAFKAMNHPIYHFLDRLKIFWVYTCGALTLRLYPVNTYNKT